MRLRNLRRAAMCLLLAGMGATMHAQDLIARQAPVDRRLRAVDSVSIQRAVERDMQADYADLLYSSWVTNRAHPYAASEVPDSFRIDLRGFCMPTLSRTTVYNTLRLLTEQGAVCQLPLDDRRVCYDAHVEAHAHFLCTRCGALHDVPLRSPTPEEQAVLPQGYKAERASLCIKGCCPDCAAHEQQQHAAY